MKSAFIGISGSGATSFLEAAEARSADAQRHSPQSALPPRPRTPMDNVPTSEIGTRDVDKRFVNPQGSLPVKKSVVSETLVALYDKRKQPV